MVAFLTIICLFFLIWLMNLQSKYEKLSTKLEKLLSDSKSSNIDTKILVEKENSFANNHTENESSSLEQCSEPKYTKDTNIIISSKTLENSFHNVETPGDLEKEIKKQKHNSTLDDKTRSVTKDKKDTNLTQSFNEIKTNSTWKIIEKQFIENWTGILGSIIIVIGAVLLGIYTSYKINEFSRFLMISGVSISLMGLYFYLRPKEKWQQFSLWMRSSSAAIFLFACLGSSQIPGLTWIHSLSKAYAFILTGIGLNLYLSVIGKHQIFASLHILLSMIALAFLPINNLVYVTFSFITLLGVFLTLKEKWNYHLLFTISLFFLYNLFRYVNLAGNEIPINYVGIICTAVISFSTIFIHYTKNYYDQKFELLPFIVHLLNWGFLGFGIFFNLGNMEWNPIPIFICSFFAYGISLEAKKRNIQWLYVTDILTSLALGIMAFISLERYSLTAIDVIGMIFIYLVIFMIVLIKQKKYFILKITQYIYTFAGFIFLLVGTKYASSFNHFYVSAIVFIIGSIFTIITEKCKFELNKYVQIINSIIVSFCFVAMLYSGSIFIKNPYIEFLPMLLLIPFIVTRQKLNVKNLDILLKVAFGLSIFLLEANTRNIYPHIFTSVCFFLFSFDSKKNRFFNQTNIYLSTLLLVVINLQINFFSLYIMNHTIFTLSILLISLFGKFFNAKNKEEKRYLGNPTKYLYHSSLILIFITTIYSLLPIYSYRRWTLGIDNGWLTTISFSALLFYLAHNFKIFRKSNSKLYKLSSLYYEIGLVLIYMLLTDRLQSFISLITIAFTFIVFYMRKYFKLERFNYYSIFMLLLYCFIFPVNAHNNGSISYWELHEYISILLSIMANITFLVLFYKDNFIFPYLEKNGVILDFQDKILLHKNKYIFYPIFISYGFTAFSILDPSLYTLILVIESFILFALSILLREKQFRFVSLGIVGISVIRLVFYDFAKSNTLTKALVFLGVGILMLLMNAIYNKFKERFES